MIGFAGLVPNCPERVWYVTGGFGAGVADVAGDGNGVLAVAVAGVAGNGNGGLAFAVLGVLAVLSSAASSLVMVKVFGFEDSSDRSRWSLAAFEGNSDGCWAVK